MAERPITIHSTCETTPDGHPHVRVGDRVRWHADHSEIFILHIKGGFFQDEPADFQILILSGFWTKDYVVAGKHGSIISNYIYDLSGSNCIPKTAAGPPDIIIDSSGIKRTKKAAAKKKAAPAKKKR